MTEEQFIQHYLPICPQILRCVYRGEMIELRKVPNEVLKVLKVRKKNMTTE